MELQQFISSVLTSIMAGIKGAETSANEHLSIVNPREYSFSDFDKMQPPEIHCKIQPVEFDIAVTVENSDSKDASGRVAVWGVGFGAGASETGRNATVSRVKFTVPIILPSVGKLK